MVEPERLWGGHPRDPELLSALAAGSWGVRLDMRTLRERLSAPLALLCTLVPADQRAVSEHVTMDPYSLVDETTVSFTHDHELLWLQPASPDGAAVGQHTFGHDSCYPSQPQHPLYRIEVVEIGHREVKRPSATPSDSGTRPTPWAVHRVSSRCP